MTPEQEMDSTRQKDLYEWMHDEYEAGYFDQESMRYRRRFIFTPLFRGFDLNGKNVAELACGSGYNSKEILSIFPSSRITGFDISSKACQAYRKVTGGQAYEQDLTRGYHGDEIFDAAVIISGLHHLVAGMDNALATIASMIKPGGALLLAEPNGGFFLEAARKLWYRMDMYFDASTERALRHDELTARAAPFFTADTVVYVGGPAYFLVLNSMIFRISPDVKRLISGPAMAAERIYNLMPGRWPFPYFIAQWRRTDIPAPSLRHV